MGQAKNRKEVTLPTAANMIVFYWLLSFPNDAEELANRCKITQTEWINEINIGYAHEYPFSKIVERF